MRLAKVVWHTAVFAVSLILLRRLQRRRQRRPSSDYMSAGWRPNRRTFRYEEE